MWPFLLAAFAIVFGVASIKEGGAVLFFDSTARLNAGDYVSFVLWSNFVAGFFYVAAGFCVVFSRVWALRLSAGIAIFTAGVFAVFGLFILSGGLYEMRTVGAMTLRTAVWVLVTLLLYRTEKTRISE